MSTKLKEAIIKDCEETLNKYGMTNIIGTYGECLCMMNLDCIITCLKDNPKRVEKFRDAILNVVAKQQKCGHEWITKNILALK